MGSSVHTILRHICHVPPLANQSTGQLTHSLCGCLRNNSVAPTALLLEQNTKEERRILKTERVCLQVQSQYLVKMRAISGLKAVFQFPFYWLYIETQLAALWHTVSQDKECTCSERDHIHIPKYSFPLTFTHTCSHTRLPEALTAFWHDSPYLFGS